MSSSNNVPAKSSVSSIIKDNFLTNNNRELPPTDKNTLITSLNYNLSHLSNSNINNNNNNNNNNNGNHLYQNVSNFKQIQNLLQQSNVGVISGSKMAQPGQAPPVPATPVPSAANCSSSAVVNPSPPANVAKLSNHLTKSKVLDGYVGFANLPNQVYRKAVKKGFEFNLMVIGESGLGKSTFINSLFLAELYNKVSFISSIVTSIYSINNISLIKIIS